jgi:hypothetical protein
VQLVLQHDLLEPSAATICLQPEQQLLLRTVLAVLDEPSGLMLPPLLLLLPLPLPLHADEGG